MDNTTLYLILALSSFLLIAVVMIHHHNCSDQIRRKQGELNSITQKLNPRIEIMEKEIIELKIKIEEVDEDIAANQ